MAKTKEQIKHDLESSGITLKQWSDINKIPFHITSEVFYGRSKCKFGTAHRCAILLGMKDGRLINSRGKSVDYVDGKPVKNSSKH